ncbi:MAG: single-stranded DNA-binding protein [Phycisphaerae bacterium]|nr:single-stranded DNA-binding protein [Phycisphaerae bacterium]
MANYNKVILAGNLTRDPQLSYLPSSTPVVDFGLAINRKWKSPDGADREETCFVDCRCFGRGAETINKYMTKGQPILVEGRLRYEQWESKEGQKRNKLSVVVDQFQFLGGPRRDGAGGEPRGTGRAAPVEAEAPPGGDVDVGDEIPF